MGPCKFTFHISPLIGHMIAIEAVMVEDLILLF